MTGRNAIYTIIFFFTIVISGCKTENHIDSYNVNLDTLKTLPDAFYAYRRGRVYLEDLNLRRYRIWFNLDFVGNVESIFKIEDFQNNKADKIATKLKIIQRFVDLSKQFKFGHISIDRINKISFSYMDGLPEQYVRTFNDSMHLEYARKKNFKLLQNGWFENIEK